MPMTALPAAPSTSSPSDFAAKADALLAALPTFVTEANALETAVDADKTAAAGSVDATAADAIATAADRVQTGLDRTAAAGAASDAAADKVVVAADKVLTIAAKDGALAAQAAAEAARDTALTTVGAMVYQGTWNASTNSPTIPAASSGNKGWYYRVAVAGTTTIDTIAEWAVGDWIVSNGSAWEKIDNTETPLASQAEAEAGTATDRLVTPLRVAQQTTARLASQAEAEAGANTTKLMTPERVAQAIAALGSGGGWVEIATAAATTSNVIFSSIPQTFSNLLVRLDAVSPSTTADFEFAVSVNNGSTYSDAVYIGSSVSAAVARSGGVLLAGYALDTGMALLATDNDETGPNLSPSGLAGGRAIHRGGVDAIRIRVSAGSFDAGTITLYGS